MSKRVLGVGSLSIGEPGSPRQLGKDVTKVTVTPSTDSEDDTPMLDGTNESGADTTTWVLGGSVMDEYDMASTATWAAQNAGKELPFVFTPNNETGYAVSGTVKVRPIALGGDVKKKNQNDFEFPLVGDPTFADA